jgi:hypothetical protein
LVNRSTIPLWNHTCGRERNTHNEIHVDVFPF